MKKIFRIILLLISLSLIGIIAIQLSWIKSMILVKKEQMRHQVVDATNSVGIELNEIKSSIVLQGKGWMGKLDDFSLDILRPTTVASRVTSAQLYEKIKKAFIANGLKDVHFEFALASTTSWDMIGYWERQSPNFITLINDSLHSFYSQYPIRAVGNIGEQLSPNEVLVVTVEENNFLVLKSLGWQIATAFLFTLIIFAAFYLTVNTLLRQKKLSQIKSDFINNMTHEFKTPLATISLAVDAIKNEKIYSDKEKLAYYGGIIKEENQRMNRQVEVILKAALLDKQKVDLKLQTINAHNVLQEVVESFSLQLAEKKGEVKLNLGATTDLIEVDEIHFKGIVSNLIDNAIKYSKETEAPQIVMTTTSSSTAIEICFEDNGIGMNRETVNKVFEKFYRAHTGNIHNVKGFGLGLSYVKSIVEAHGGNIKVDSVLGQGSAVRVSFPIKK